MELIMKKNYRELVCIDSDGNLEVWEMEDNELGDWFNKSGIIFCRIYTDTNKFTTYSTNLRASPPAWLKREILSEL